MKPGDIVRILEHYDSGKYANQHVIIKRIEDRKFFPIVTTPPHRRIGDDSFLEEFQFEYNELELVHAKPIDKKTKAVGKKS